MNAPPQPNAFAPSDRNQWLPGLVVPGFFSGSFSTINGTSAAAPQIARALAEAADTGGKSPLQTPVEPLPGMPEGARVVEPAPRRQRRAMPKT